MDGKSKFTVDPVILIDDDGDDRSDDGGGDHDNEDYSSLSFHGSQWAWSFVLDQLFMKFD